MVAYLGSLVQSCRGEGGTLQANITGMCGKHSQCLDHTGFAPAHSTCAFPVYTAQAPGCSAGELSKAGSWFHTFPMSKLLRFRFSGAPERHRLGWGCIFCLSNVQAARVTSCLASTVPGGLCILTTSPDPAAQSPGCTTRPPSLVCRVSPPGN